MKNINTNTYFVSYSFESACWAPLYYLFGNEKPVYLEWKHLREDRPERSRQKISDADAGSLSQRKDSNAARKNAVCCIQVDRNGSTSNLKYNRASSKRTAQLRRSSKARRVEHRPYSITELAASRKVCYSFLHKLRWCLTTVFHWGAKAYLKGDSSLLIKGTN